MLLSQLVTIQPLSCVEYICNCSDFECHREFIFIIAPPWTAARCEGGMSRDGHSTRNYDSQKKRARAESYNSPQFAMGHSLRLSRLSVLRLVPDRYSLGSAIRTVHRTVAHLGPPAAQA